MSVSDTSVVGNNAISNNDSGVGTMPVDVAATTPSTSSAKVLSPEFIYVDSPNGRLAVQVRKMILRKPPKFNALTTFCRSSWIPSQVETFEVDLERDTKLGLGITVAGYVHRREEISGVFVKNLVPNTAAERSSVIQVHDLILEVNGQTLEGLSHADSVRLLVNSGRHVKLKLVRFLPGSSQAACLAMLREQESETQMIDIHRNNSAKQQREKEQQQQQRQEQQQQSSPSPPKPQSPPSSSKPSSPTHSIPRPTQPPPDVPVRPSSQQTSDTATNGANIELTNETAINSAPTPATVDDESTVTVEHVQTQDAPPEEAADDLPIEPEPMSDEEIVVFWKRIVGDDHEIIIGCMEKPPSGGLGLSLEGTVDVVNGAELRPHHYIQRIHPDGPAGKCGRLRPGDELLEINSVRLHGASHVDVRRTIASLPGNAAVKLVVSRPQQLPVSANVFMPRDSNEMKSTGRYRDMFSLLSGRDNTRMIKAKSEQLMCTYNDEERAGREEKRFMKSRSLEPLHGMAVWSLTPLIITLHKGNKGLGFTVLDYQDSMHAGETVIVIRSLVPGGPAHQDGRIVPGDRLLYVNDVSLTNATLDQAVNALKSAPIGPVVLGIAKPLPIDDENASFILSHSPIFSRSERLLAKSSFNSPRAKRKRTDQFNTAALAGVDWSAEARRRLYPQAYHSYTPHDNVSLRSDQAISLYGSYLSMYSWSPASTASPSPSASPSLLRSGWAQDILRMPLTMEKTVKIRKGRGHLGMTLEPYDKGVNGCIVNTLLPTGVIGRDGHIHLGDFITKINNENLRGVTGSQARAILKRAEVIGPDITLHYIPLEEAERFKERHSRDVSPDPSVSSVNRLSPKVFPKYYQSPYMSRRGLTSVPSSDALSLDTTSVDISQIDNQSTSIHFDTPASLLATAPQPTPEPTSSEQLADQAQSSRIQPLSASPPPPPPPPPVPPQEQYVTQQREAPSIDSPVDVPEISVEATGSSVSHSESASSSQIRSPDYEKMPGMSQNASDTLSNDLPSVPETSPPRDNDANVSERLPEEPEEAASPSGDEHQGSPDYADTESIPEIYPRGASIEERPANYKPVSAQRSEESSSKSGSPTEPVIKPSTKAVPPPELTTQAEPEVPVEIVDLQQAEPQVEPTVAVIDTQETTTQPSNEAKTDLTDLPKHSAVTKISSSGDAASKTSVSRTSSSGSASTTVQSISTKCKFWGEPRTVELSRQPNQSFGISIVGGRVEVSQKGGMPGTGNTVAGIFIKSVLPESPAGKSNQLNMGDRIISVNDHDLRNATHEQAVEVIRHATNPVRFVVQSIHSFAPHQIVNANDSSTTANSSPTASRSATTKSAPPTVISRQSDDSLCKATSPTKTDRPGEPEDIPLKVNGHDGEETKTEAKQKQPSTESEKQDSGSPPQPGSMKASSEPPNLDDDDGDHAHDMPTTSIESLRAKFSELDGEVMQMNVKRQPGQALGISLAGHKDRSKLGVFVVNITADSPLLKTNPPLMLGDELLQINDSVLHGKSHLHATSTICQQSGSELHFVVLRPRVSEEQRAAVSLPQSITPVSPTTTKAKLSDTPSVPNPNMLTDGNSSEKGSSIESEPTSVETVVVGPQPIDESLVMPRPQAERKILVKKGTTGFGITLTDGAAGNNANTRELHVGDQVLAVDGQAVAGMSSAQVAEVMQKVGQNGQVELTLAAQSAVPTPSKQHHQTEASCSQQPSSSSTGSTQVSTNVKKSSGGGSAATTSTSNPSTVTIEAGKETLIEIDKGGHGLGLSIVGGSDTVLGSVVIHEVYPDGAAANDGRLKPGDQLIEVNSQSLRNVTHDEAINMLRHTPSHVRLVVYRDVNMQMSLLDPTQIYNVIEVELQKKPGKGLGLSIVGRKSEPGVYLSEVVKGGAAEADGRLMQGDQILAVNGTDVTNALQEEVAAILKTSVGRVHLKVGRWKLGDDASGNKTQANTQSQTTNTQEDAKPTVAAPAETTVPAPPVAASKPTTPPAAAPSEPTPTVTAPTTSAVPTVTIESPQNSMHESPASATTTATEPPKTAEPPTTTPPAADSPSAPPSESNFQPAKPEPESEIKLLEHLTEDGSESMMVDLMKIPGQTLGMGIGRRSRGILVTSVQEGSAAAAVLKVGDRIMAVNGQIVTDQSSAVEFVKNSAAHLRLQIARPNTDENQPTRPLSPGAGLARVITLTRQAGEDYGFSIVGGATEGRPTQPILIKRVYQYGAARDCALRTGDQIVRVNDQSLVGLSHHECVQLLQAAHGRLSFIVVPMEHDEHPNPKSPLPDRR